jgi:hypothetical protein
MKIEHFREGLGAQKRTRNGGNMRTEIYIGD